MLNPRMALVSVAFLLLAATAAVAAPPPRMRVDGSVPLPSGSPVRIADKARQAELERLPGWTDFLSRHGPWNALWNNATKTPHRAFGRGIALPSFADDPQSVDRAVRGFVAEHSALFGAPTLATVAVDRAGGRWYVRYRQTVNGVPVLFSDWEFRVGLNGKLFAFGADLERPAGPVDVTALVVGAAAREAAKQGLSFDPATDRVEGGEQLYLVPSATENGAELRLVYDVRVRTSDPPGNWYTLVDARTGEVLYRQNLVRYDISGVATGMVQPDLPTSPFIARPLKHLFVTVGVNQAVTDTSGAYLSPLGTGTVATVRARILGQFCDVNRADGFPDADTSTTATSPATVNFPFRSTNSHDAERDAYYNVNIAHDYAKFLEPGFTGLDYVMPVAVNIISETCNAYWDRTGVNFEAAGGGCPNTATMPDVVFHEYGHGVNDKLYIQYGAPSGMDNGALHEGLADVNAAFIQNSPDVGKGFYGPGTILRSLNNTKRWPQDASGDPHASGLIIGGACWDMRLKLGLPIAEHLVHFAKHGLPDDPDDGVAMSEFFVETLVADDNDADLSNGTPHSSSIAMAFNKHGIGTGYFINISHAPLPDQPSGGFYSATAVIQYTGPFGQLDSGSPMLHYSLNSGPYQETNMQPTGNPNEFRGILPAPAPVVVRYYITAGDNLGSTNASPPLAPAKVYSFLAGSGTTGFLKDMETEPGWVVGDPFDTAVTGIWLRADPVGTFVPGTSIPVQPEDDHTPGSGTQCFVTGNADPGAGAGTNDVDGGHTTLSTSVFSALPAGMTHPFIEYYRWYSNNGGSTPGEDFWTADISNDGGSTWHSVEHTQTTENSWMRVIFRIEDLVTPTASMKMRFIAADEGAGSLVEAAVDDFRLIGFPAVAAVEPGRAGAAPLAVTLQPSPFAARTSMRFTLPVSGDVRLSVLDVNGRLVRTLVDGTREAGEHSVAWDGRDGSNARIPVGMYFVRLEQAGKTVTKAVVHVE